MQHPTAERLLELPEPPPYRGGEGGGEVKAETEKTWRSAKLSTHADNNGGEDEAVEEDVVEASQGSGKRNGNKTRTANNCSCTFLLFICLTYTLTSSLFLSLSLCE